MDRIWIGTAVMALGLFSAMAAASPAFAQANRANPPAAAMTTSSPPLSKADRDFVDDAVQSGSAEVALGKLAQKSLNPDVRRFADRMISDHTEANRRLTAIAQANHIPVPNTPDIEHRKLRENLANQHDGNFDRDYARAMVADHDRAVKLFQQEEESGDNPNLKAFARDTLPILQEHRKMAAALAAKLGATAAQ
jgi:putative membrane protein